MLVDDEVNLIFVKFGLILRTSWFCKCSFLMELGKSYLVVLSLMFTEFLRTHFSHSVLCVIE